jgi:hypothetical protein
MRVALELRQIAIVKGKFYVKFRRMFDALTFWKHLKKALMRLTFEETDEDVKAINVIQEDCQYLSWCRLQAKSNYWI